MATTFYQVKNNVGSTVTGTYAPGSGTLTLADASGFPASYPYRVSTFGPDGTPKSILSITGRTGNVLTVAGAIDGTTDVVLAIGDLVRMRVAAGALADIHTAVNAVETAIASYGNVVTHAASDFATASAFTSHTSNTSNPHSVTAAQTGAYTTAQVDTLLASKQAAGSYVPTTTTVAGHPLSSNVTITPADIGAQVAGSYLTGTLVTTVGNPGSNTNVPSEAAVRSAIAGSGGGTVSSVGLTMPSGFAVANSPVTTTGTLAVTTSLSGYVKASGGAFTAGSIAAGDLPDTYVPTSRLVAGHALTGNVTVTASDVGLGSVTNDAQLKVSQLVTSVGTPGSDTNVPSEKAVRTAIGAGGGGSYDLLSPLTAAEISVTGATTLTIGRAHVCSGSSNYTVNLPAVTGNAGNSLLVRVAPTATALVTIDAGTGVTIDGTQTVILWAGEDIIFRCDGTNWNLGPGRRRAFICTMRLNGGGSPAFAQSIASDSVVPILLNSTDSDPSGQMADTTNNRIVIRRPGTYMVIGLNVYTSLSAATNRAIMNVYKNGSALFAGETYGGATSNPSPSAMKVVSLAAGDSLTLIAYLVGATAYAYGDPTGTSCYLTVAEIFS